ncbi:hypothetical protein GGI12_005373 [Dipsacomyces acuminosporus]|nr:hypothetical protein GGI12_005373 [Dipsacomyces acuminosporus]
MPRLEELTVDCMEPCGSRNPAPLADDASQMPHLRGQFAKLVRIRAPMLDTRLLPAAAPALQSLNITCANGAFSPASVPSDQDVEELLDSDLPLHHICINSQLVLLNA